MEEKQVQDILIDVLYCVVNDREPDSSIKEKLSPDVFDSLYCLAKKHDIAHIVSNFIHKNKIDVPSDTLQKFKKAEIMSVYRYEQMKYAYTQICDTFDSEGISYIALKGSVIQKFYPTQNMRTSCDIDILVREQDLQRAIEALELKGYSRGKRNYHDIPMVSPNRVCLELHFNLQENISNLDCVLKDAWGYAEQAEKSRYDFKNNFFVFYMYAHMAYHFLSGGCGIRSLIDIWIAEIKMGISYTCAKDLLKRAGIYQFASEMSNLAHRCFTDNTRDDFSNIVLGYILNGGVYGSKENDIAVKKSKSNNIFDYVINRLFIPYRTMVTLFPILKKLPVLLPFCWVIRWLKMLFHGKTKTMFSELTTANNMTDYELKQIRTICSRLGL